MKKKAFTLIELIAVLVILAILALIVTPLVFNIINKSKIFADKRSIDVYGRSVELAIANYLLDNGDFPTDISQLSVEYSGDEVVCSTTQLNNDSSVYLAGCTVGGRSVDYTYGKEEAAPTYTAYSVGDKVSYNNVDYYVIKDSDTTEDSVTLLKAEPLTASDITTYSAGTGAQTDGTGGMQYHSSSSAYEGSYVKTTVDSWKIAQAPAASEARLITKDELVADLGYEYYEEGTSSGYRKTELTPSWVYNSNYFYWTSTQCNGSSSGVKCVTNYGGLYNCDVILNLGGVVRPVVSINKSYLN